MPAVTILGGLPGLTSRASAPMTRPATMKPIMTSSPLGGHGPRDMPTLADQTQPSGAIPGRGAVGYVGLGGRQGSASATGQNDGNHQ